MNDANRAVHDANFGGWPTEYYFVFVEIKTIKSIKIHIKSNKSISDK